MGVKVALGGSSSGSAVESGSPAVWIGRRGRWRGVASLREASRGEEWGQEKATGGEWQARAARAAGGRGIPRWRWPARFPSEREVEEELEDLVVKIEKFKRLSVN